MEGGGDNLIASLFCDFGVEVDLLLLGARFKAAQGFARRMAEALGAVSGKSESFGYLLQALMTIEVNVSPPIICAINFRNNLGAISVPKVTTQNANESRR